VGKHRYLERERERERGGPGLCIVLVEKKRETHGGTVFPVEEKYLLKHSLVPLPLLEGFGF
jgi:hypothetical protein